MLTELEINPPCTTVAVTCQDIARRPREVLVTPLPDQRVMVTVPPGEVAVFRPEEADKLRGALPAAPFRPTAQPASTTTINGYVTYAVPCSDTMGRDRAVTVTAHRDGRVIVAAPPGGVATFSHPTVGPFRAVLAVAIGAARLAAVTA